MANLYEIADRHKAALLRRERAAATQMVRAYGVAWGAIRERLGVLTAQIEAARRAGQVVSTGWLMRQDRLQSLQVQTEAQIWDFARFAEPLIVAEQRAAVAAAQEQVPVQVTAALGRAPSRAAAVTAQVAFNRLPTAALEDLVGFLSDGSPLRSLLDELPRNAGAAIREKLLAGVAQGQNPRLIAAAVRKDLGGNLTRALVISRTEVIRPYRESSRRTMEANPAVVEEWIWHSALDPRTCAACIAMHGSVHPVTESLASHPVCRCTALPKTKSWAELLGDPTLPDTRPPVISGGEWFSKQSEARQVAILGKSAHALYASGEATLADFVGVKHSERWGPSRFVRSVAAVREAIAPVPLRRAA